MLGRLARLGLVAAILTGSGLVLTVHKTVTIVEDGRSTVVETTSLTVGQLLDRRGVRVGPHDVVRPPLDARLAEGARVVVERAERVAFVVNGRVRTMWVTADTVAGVLEEAGLDRSTSAHAVAAADVRSGRAPVLRSPVTVTLHVGGRREVVVTDAPTGGDLLTLIGRRADRNDMLEPGARTVPTDGMVVRLTKVTVKMVVDRREVAYRTFTRYDDSMPGGETRVLREGRPGQERRTFRVTLVNGAERSRSLLGTRLVRPPVDEIVVMGSGGAASGASGSQAGEASWYERDGLGAAHRWLPKGTRVTVTNLDTGASVTVIINDRGPYGVEGRIVDLSREAFARIAPLSAGVCRVRLSW